jgi:ribonucleoside-diphosphate reductase alpha chain
VQLLLLNLGIKSSIMDRSRAPRDGLFPYRTKAGELRSHGSDGVLFELGIFGKSRGLFLREVGFLNDKQRRLEPMRNAGCTRSSEAIRGGGGSRRPARSTT